ncbi:malto-oligosyltrehalose trehalohydrolase [Pedobacter sp. AW1-32]|uniref:malto-oligosyltrehalose trehalohydrolase n=1 Tax=Pedobacter sp. AW1-32 TaxID=3383026 RepID=UPI003FEF148D
MNDVFTPEINKRRIGLNFTNAQAEIWLWAPNAIGVQLLFGNSNAIALESKPYGYWFLSTQEIKPGDEYCFEIQLKDQNFVQRADPASVYQKNGIAHNSTAFDLQTYQWSDQDWKGIDRQDLIFYEIHVAAFTAEGTFQSLQSKLDYLVELGITAIEIMPVAQFSGNRNWGYDGVFPFAVQNSYGGPQEFQEFINVCHQKGLAVILDVVYNHIGPEGNHLTDFGPFFTEKYHTPWGDAINFDDSGADGVRNFYLENALMWLRDFHIDGLRLDAVHAIKDFSAKHFLEELRILVDQLAEQTQRKYHLIAELDLNDNRFINPIEKGGYGMHAQWIDEFHHALRVSTGQQKHGYYEDFDGVADLARAYQNAYVYNGQFSKHRNRNFGRSANENTGDQFVVFSQNHDQVGNRMKGERSSVLVRKSQQQLMAAAVLLSPYLPLIFMGEEYAETNPFPFFVSYSDPDLIEAVRKGRKTEFAAFAQDEMPDPQSDGTFNSAKLDWTKLKKPEHVEMFDFYKKLIQLRKENTVLHTLNRNSLEVKIWPSDASVLLLRRWNADQEVFIWFNFSSQDHEIARPDVVGPLDILVSYSEQNPITNHSIYLPAESFIVFSHAKI